MNKINIIILSLQLWNTSLNTTVNVSTNQMTRIQIFLISLQTAQNRFVLLLMISFLQKLPKPRVFDDFDLENRYCDEIEQRERANVDFVAPVGNRPELDPVEEEGGRAEEEDEGGG